MSEFLPLDVTACPLEGVNLIEASAGTGKTWNICGLYLRLLLERNLSAKEILVVTFTKAATAELRERIRGRIVDALAGLAERETTGRTADPLVGPLLDRLANLGLDAGTLRARLELARESFDEAAICTIHSFCQRALAETPLAAGLPLELEVVQDDGERIRQAVNDFWRRHIAHAPARDAGIGPEGAAHPGIHRLLASYLLEKRDSPETYAELLRPVLGKPLCRQLWPEDLDEPILIDDAPALRAYAVAGTLWRDRQGEIVDGLTAALPKLNGQSYKPEALERGRREWSAWFDSGQALRGDHRFKDNKLGLYRNARLLAGTKRAYAGQTPEHPFFGAAEQLLAACEALDRALLLARLRLLRDLAREVPPALREEKRRQRVVAFDDMLYNLHQALTGGAHPGLAATLRARYPAALIDEFQDTDPLQFDIFRRLYDGAAGPLFMVGDPKQAIYSFRNADLHTYLGAQDHADRRYTLSSNQRSVPGLIAGANALFGRNRQAFLQPGIVYHPVSRGAKPLTPFRDDSGQTMAPLQVWLLPRGEDGDFLPRAEALTRSAGAVAAEIVRLLNAARAGRVTLGERPLGAGDIAVLVRSHRQGRWMRQALAGFGVGCVELSQASVFDTAEAEDLERLLLAIAWRRDALVRAALATELIGCDAGRIDGFLEDEAAFFDYLERFADYRELWESRGFPVMFRTLLRELEIEARLLGLPRGERRLTNLLHLGELLAQAAREHEGVDALLRWLASRRRETDAEDNVQLRLESDSQLVQIVTIHKAKGLEYPVVFCPFLWDGFRNGRTGAPDLRQYHDGADTVLDFRPEAKEDEDLKARIRDEESAELLRLIYVAITRAAQRCYLLAGCYNRRNSRGSSPYESTRSLLNWLACGDGIEPADWFDSRQQRAPAGVEAAWWALPEQAAGGADSLAVASLPDWPANLSLSLEEHAAALSARQAHRRLHETWNRGSFTSMVRNRPQGGAAADHDADAMPGPALRRLSAAVTDHDILRFPAGAGAGSCIHRVFERADFSLPAAAGAVIREALREFPQTPVHEDGRHLAPEPMLEGMLQAVLAAELPLAAGASLRLRDLQPGDQAREVTFTLSARRVTAERVNALLHEHGYELEPLDFWTIHGYLGGAIDLVFRHGGRYYLLDWKSNHLGHRPEDYADAPLRMEMQRHAYPLQYLLYGVALHRYLRARLPGYDPDAHFGGALYLFVRGVRPGWTQPDGRPAGVFFDRPARETLMALDALIGHEEGNPS